MVINTASLMRVEDLYTLFKNPLLHTACTAYPIDSLRLAPQWNYEENSDLGIEVKQQIDNLEFYDIAGFKYCGLEAIKEAQIVANVEGNCHIVLDIDDGLDVSEPVNFESIRAITGGALFGRNRINYNRGYNGQEPYYTASMDYVGNNNQFYYPNIHPDRVLRFWGVKATGEMLYQNGFYNQSLIEVLFDSFCQMTMTTKSASNYLQSSSAFWYKMDGLADMVLQGKEEDVKTRLELFKAGLSSIGVMVLDATREDAGFINRSFSGIDSLVELIVDMFVAHTGIPRSRLLGGTKQGAMSESGKSDQHQWAELVKNYQQDRVSPYLNRLSDLTMAGLGIAEGSMAYEIGYPSILSKTDKEVAEEASIFADADSKYHAMGLSGQTIIESRFGGAEFNTSITLGSNYMDEPEPMLQPNQPNQPDPQFIAESVNDSDPATKIQLTLLGDNPMSSDDYEAILKLLELEGVQED
jgi:phage-related protein (TIGR01555 family)